MIGKFYLIIGFFLLCSLQVLAVDVGTGRAADCKALYEKVRKERTLLIKKKEVLEAMKVCPGNAPIIYQYGYTMERLRKYEDALEQYKKAVSIDPGYAKAYFSVGDIQMLLRNYREAVIAYQIGLQHESDERAKISLKEARAKYKKVTGKEAPSPPPIKKIVGVQKTVVKKSAAPKVTAASKKQTAQASYAEAPIVRLQIPFYKKSTELSQDARDVLAVVVGQAMNRSDMKNARFEIGGHTDNIGDPYQNEKISKKRAEVVRKYLLDNFGISGNRLTMAFHGQKVPKVPNTSPANQELNRRVEFTRIN